MNLLSIHLFLQPLTFNVYSQQTLFSRCYSAQITVWFLFLLWQWTKCGGKRWRATYLIHALQHNTFPQQSTPLAHWCQWLTMMIHTRRQRARVCCWRNPQCSGNVFLMKETEDHLLKPLVRHQVENAYENIFNYVTAFYQTFSAFWKTTKTIWTFKIFVR